ncbi:hypothetical protein BDV25DRAFT_140556 [Aspergillus avenaceus]|uniref:Uncharacterized protein n=1 Tax=Aspergillus avenaceus TaxID=36643 RepID=A0A5N6TTL9_ASPAV|nr:hypothetical protein BDV25DRAFT_140556 [Aspergillus avenaceus]
MRLFTPALLVLTLLCLSLGLHGPALAQQFNDSYRPEDLSACASQCMHDAVGPSRCSFSDIECQCEDKAFIEHVSACAVRHCSVDDLYILVRGDAKHCNRPNDDVHSLMVGLAVLTPAVTFIMVTFRISARLWTARKLWWDDIMHIMAGVFTIPLSVFGNYCVKQGFGYHLYNLPIQSTSNITSLLFWWYMCQVFWPFTILFVKLSILFLYLRIFPIHLFRIFDFCCMGFMITSFLITTPMAIWQCNPISAAWDYNVDGAPCLKISAVAYANATVNITTEVLILILPLPVLRTLHVSKRKKIALFSVFSVGVMYFSPHPSFISLEPRLKGEYRVIAIASARMPSLRDMGTYYDPPYAQAPAFLLSCAEAAMAQVCAAAPVIYSALMQLKRNSRKSSEASPSSSQGQNRVDPPAAPGSDPSNRKYHGMVYSASSMNMSDVAIMGRGWIQGQRRSQGSGPSVHHLEHLRQSSRSDPGFLDRRARHRGSDLSAAEEGCFPPPTVDALMEQV